MSNEKIISEINYGPNMQSMSLLRGRWSVQLTTPRVSRDNDKIIVEPEILKVKRRFNGGMIYEVRGKSFILGEYAIGGYPFLVIFGIEDRKLLDEMIGFPSNIKQNIMDASAQIVRNIKLPDNMMREIQVDLTEHMSKLIDPPEGWILMNTIMKAGNPNVSAGPCTVFHDVGGCDYPPVGDKSNMIAGESILL